MQNKKAFSLVEIIITISIIALLAVIWLSSKQWYDDNMNNIKIISDIETINNALESYTQENSSLPMPWWNTNFFTINTNYSHSYEDTETFWVYWSITEKTLPKKYLDVLPLDPRTNSYYSYWKTKETTKIIANQFELASVQNMNWEYQAFVTWNYSAEIWPHNLIREYNGSNFVYDKSKSNLPYNPDELILIATVNGEVKREWDTITTWIWETKEIYFSDGSVSILEENSSITLEKLDFPNENNLNTLVKLSLWAGTIWTKATHLNNESEFKVYTTDSTAAVRGTIFWVKKDSPTAPTEVLVIDWVVEVYENETKEKIIDLEKDESIRVIEWVENGISTLKKLDYENIEDNFIISKDIRGAETMATINQELNSRATNKNKTPEEETFIEKTAINCWENNENFHGLVYDIPFIRDWESSMITSNLWADNTKYTVYDIICNNWKYELGRSSTIYYEYGFKEVLGAYVKKVASCEIWLLSWWFMNGWKCVVIIDTNLLDTDELINIWETWYEVYINNSNTPIVLTSGNYTWKINLRYRYNYFSIYGINPDLRIYKTSSTISLSKIEIKQ